MPLAAPDHGHAPMEAFFWGLLPDNQAVATRIERAFVPRPRGSRRLMVRRLDLTPKVLEPAGAATIEAITRVCEVRAHPCPDTADPVASAPRTKATAAVSVAQCGPPLARARLPMMRRILARRPRGKLKATWRTASS